MKRIVLLLISILLISIPEVCFAETKDPCGDEALKVSAKNSACKELDKIDEATLWNYNQLQIDRLQKKCDIAYENAYDSCSQKRKKKKNELSAKLLGMKTSEYQKWRKPIVPIEDCGCTTFPFKVEGCNDNGNAKYNSVEFECDKKNNCTCYVDRAGYAKINGIEECGNVMQTISKITDSVKKYDDLICEVLSDHINIAAYACLDLPYMNYLTNINKHVVQLEYDSELDNKELQNTFNASLKAYINNCTSDKTKKEIRLEVTADLLGMGVEEYKHWRVVEVPIKDCDCSKFPITIEGCNSSGNAKYKDAQCGCDKKNNCKCYMDRADLAKLNGTESCSDIINSFSKMCNSVKKQNLFTCDALSNHLNIVAYVCFGLSHDNYMENLKNHIAPSDYEIKINNKDLEKIFSASLAEYKKMCQNNE